MSVTLEIRKVHFKSLCHAFVNPKRRPEAFFFATIDFRRSCVPHSGSAVRRHRRFFDAKVHSKNTSESTTLKKIKLRAINSFYTVTISTICFFVRCVSSKL